MGRVKDGTGQRCGVACLRTGRGWCFVDGQAGEEGLDVLVYCARFDVVFEKEVEEGEVVGMRLGELVKRFRIK